MVRSQALPFENYSVATTGQLAWVYLNTIIDADEKRRRVHLKCLPKLDQEVCEVCYEPLVNEQNLDPEIAKKVYRPGVDGVIEDVEIEQPVGPTYSRGNWEMIPQDE